MTLHTESILTLRETMPRRILMSEILAVVTKCYNVTVNDIKSPRRNRIFVRAKHAASYLCRVYTSQSYSQIAHKVNKDHSSVIHGDKRVQVNPGKYEPELSRCIAALEGRE